MRYHTDRNKRIAPLLSALMLLCGALLLGLLLMSPSHAAAQGLDLPEDPLSEPGRWLSDDRWSEVRYGLSIREPQDPTRVADTAQGDVMRWALPGGIRIRLAFARGVYEGVFKNPDGTAATRHMPAKIDVLKKQISDELKATSGQVINTRADQVIEVAGTGGIINYYIIKPPEQVGKPYLHGVALLQLDDMSVAVLRLECPPDQIVNAVSTFECMVHSIQIEPAKDVNQRLHGWLKNSEQLLANLTQQDRIDAMQPDSLYRVLEAGKDIGFVRIWQRYQDKAYYKQLKERRKQAGGTDRLEGIDRFQATGNAIFVQSRLESRGAVLERLYEAIDEIDSVNTYWQIKNAMRYKNDPNNRRSGAWVETGVRGTATIGGESMDHLRITREGTPPRHMVEYLLQRERDPERKLRYPSADPRSYPSGEVVEKAWPTPKRAFLSFVDAQLMPAMLPNEEKTYAFTAYHPDTTRVDIRLMRVKPNADGGKTVFLRPILDMSEQVLTFNANNELISHTYPDGRSMRQTTRQELARIWGVKLRD